MNNELYNKLTQIKTLIESCLGTISGAQEPTRRISKKSPFKNINEDDRILLIVNKIKSCDETDKIESCILDKNGMQAKILLPYYICFKYFQDQSLTTGDIEKITSELRTKIKTSNVSSAIANGLQKYLHADSIRKKGKPIKYTLNRKGAKYFESLLNTNET